MYKPSDDSYFFADFLKEYLSKLENKNKMSLLDMGTGSGILAKTAKDSGLKNIEVADINKNVLKKLKFRKYHSNLFSKIPKSKKFDIIVFNAPYLPEDENEPLDSKLETTGGKNGDEVSLEFIKQAKDYIKNGGKIFLLISSLTPLKNLKKFKPKIAKKKKIFFEELIILEFSFSSFHSSSY